ncbi:MAG: hypothetical protein HY216_12345 [Candidatus Rokubacteria bacterium]|nr:hypothetical protein [Candidatus Rokubacteria bacterium]
MAKLWAVLIVLASFVLAAPIIESGTLGTDSQFFQAIGTADGGGGGGD